MDHDAPCIGFEQPTHHVDGGGLASPVGTKKTKDLSFVYLQAELVNRLEVTVGLGQTFCSQYDFRHSFTPRMFNLPINLGITSLIVEIIDPLINSKQSLPEV
jgi:hypothetical protein